MTASATKAPAETAKALLRRDPVDLEAIAHRFEGLDRDGRTAEMQALSAKDMARLWAACEQNAPLAVRDLLPPEGETDGTWIWHGVNSLPLFRRFQKRVLKETEQTLAGYNEQAMGFLTGPGCFTVRACRPDEPGSIVFDYTITPKSRPTGCRKVVPADKGMSRFVYGGMLDYMHRVSGNVVIGRAWRHGKASDNYFMLARGPRA